MSRRSSRLRAKRDHKIQARNREDRREIERQRRPRARELE
jgi:hypothetical protein